MSIFSTQPKQRRFFHDIILACTLSATAGGVNTASYFAFEILTTNVTGHVAVLAGDVVALNYQAAQLRLLWMAAFFFGALTSGLLLETVGKNSNFSHTIPLAIEMLILILVAWFGADYDYSREYTQILAGSLLFAMGLQNAMVTMISGSVIRTTHLTGLFTDAGISTARLILVKFKFSHYVNLSRKFFLQVFIIISFLLGAIVGGYLFAHYLFWSYTFPLILLFFALLFDILDLRKKRKKLRKELV